MTPEEHEMHILIDKTIVLLEKFVPHGAAILLLVSPRKGMIFEGTNVDNESKCLMCHIVSGDCDDYDHIPVPVKPLVN